MRKPNVQSPLDRLPDAHQHKLYEMLKGASYEEALPKVRAEFGVRTTVSSLAMWEALTAKDTKSIVSLGRLLVSMDAGRRDDDALRLAREKFEAAERRAAQAKATISDRKLTPEEREAKLKEIFGL